jgi:predicted transcriptional regulator
MAFNNHGLKPMARDIDFWDTNPDEIKLEVKKAIEEIENGQFVANEDVMKNYVKWLKK